jgi:hypothetical protein
MHGLQLYILTRPPERKGGRFLPDGKCQSPLSLEGVGGEGLSPSIAFLSGRSQDSLHGLACIQSHHRSIEMAVAMGNDWQSHIRKTIEWAGMGAR